MRKSVLSICVLLFLIMPLNATSSLSALSRGDAVLTSNEVNYAFFHNPAFLTSKNFSFLLPVNAQIYNISGLISNDLIANITAISSMDEESMVNGLLSLLREFSGTMPLLSMDESLSFTVKGFGLNLALREEVITTGGSVATTLSACIEGELSAGFGFDIPLDEYHISLGMTPKLLYRVYTSPVGIETAVDFMLDSSLSEAVTVYEALALSMDIGAYVSFPLGFSSALVLRNIGSDYEAAGTDGSVEELENPFAIDTAIGWSGKWSFISLQLELGLRGWNNIRDTIDLMRSFNAGMSLGLTDFVSINAGISGGYPSLGLELDIFCIDLIIAYYWQDYGINYGLNPRDIIALEVAIAFD